MDAKEEPSTAHARTLPSSEIAGAPRVLAPLGARLPGVDGLRAIRRGASSSITAGSTAHPRESPWAWALSVALSCLTSPLASAYFLPSPDSSSIGRWPWRSCKDSPCQALGGTFAIGLCESFRRTGPSYAVTGVIVPAVMVRNSTTLELGRISGQFDDLLKNMLLMHNYFRDSWDTGIGPVWSLAIELHFYLALPLLGLLAAQMGGRFLGSKGRAFVALLPAIVMGFVGVIGSLAEAWTSDWSNDYWHSVLVKGIFYHADLFAFGIGLAVLWAATTQGLVRLPRWWRPAAVTGLVCAALLAVGLTDRGILDHYQGAFQYEALLSLSCVLLIALVVLPNEDRDARPS